MKNYFRKADIILMGVLVLISFVGLLFSGGDGEILTVRHNGQIVYEGSITEDGRIEIDGEYHNVIVVADGKAYMQESDCPGGDCLRQGTVSRSGGRIACAPNGVIVSVSGDSDESGVDAVAG